MTSHAENRRYWSLGTAWVAAIAASVCCVVPLVLVLLGISGAWISNVTALDAWRPWFTAITLLSLASAFWFNHRATRCAPEGACSDPGVARKRQVALWVATAGVTLLLLFPYYIGWFV